MDEAQHVSLKLPVQSDDEENRAGRNSTLDSETLTKTFNEFSIFSKVKYSKVALGPLMFTEFSASF
jgi:hypothetical protein